MSLIKFMILDTLPHYHKLLFTMEIWELKRLSTFKMEFNSRELKKEKKEKTCMTSNQKITLVQNYYFCILTKNWNVIIVMQSINKFILWINAGQITSMPKNERAKPCDNLTTVSSNFLHIKQNFRNTIHITINFEVQK